MSRCRGRHCAKHRPTPAMIVLLLDHWAATNGLRTSRNSRQSERIIWEARSTPLHYPGEAKPYRYAEPEGNSREDREHIMYPTCWCGDDHWDPGH